MPPASLHRLLQLDTCVHLPLFVLVLVLVLVLELELVLVLELDDARRPWIEALTTQTLALQGMAVTLVPACAATWGM